ncbi:hypothetical protein NQ314_007758 [Rhamnusium bicolor]|uniref:Homing endonuclease LAGLIDADG domain-containing protein n=1 Tax=Rhamnusium bicolor TaxID=1586634 RepID=A0AAV8YJ54_9CUCU|nr:hypothetical protein NQ314_007758 [Rhamnusium bicolor]
MLSGIRGTYVPYRSERVNSVRQTIELPKEKREKILKAIEDIKVGRSCKIRQFARFVGLLVSACPAVKYGWLYTRYFERIKDLALFKNNQNYNSLMDIPADIKPDLKWWKENIHSAFNDIRRDTFNLEIFTDASLSSWGIYCNGKSTHGFWSTKDKENHINYLELLNVYYGLMCFAKNCKSCKILLRVGNTHSFVLC